MPEERKPEQKLEFKVLVNGEKGVLVNEVRVGGVKDVLTVTSDDYRRREGESPEEYLERMRKLFVDLHPTAEKVGEEPPKEYLR